MNIEQLRSVSGDYARYVSNADSRATQAVIQFYDLGKESPSTARCVLVDEVKKRADYLTKEKYQEDIKIMGQSEAVKTLKTHAKNLIYYGFEVDAKEEVKPYIEAFSESFRMFYPKTGDLRCRIIDMGRVSFGTIHRKLGNFQKFLFWRKAVSNEVSQMFRKVIR